MSYNRMYEGTGVSSIACMARVPYEKISNGPSIRRKNFYTHGQKAQPCLLALQLLEVLVPVLGAKWAASPAIGRISQDFTRH